MVILREHESMIELKEKDLRESEKFKADLQKKVDEMQDNIDKLQGLKTKQEGVAKNNSFIVSQYNGLEYN